jgi:transcriptional regulator with XRE-family HTH domain
MDEPVNPIKELRESLNLTHAELCKNLNIAPSTLVRTEQGLYAAIPPIIKGWYDEHSLLGSTPISDYRRFQNGVRGRNLPRLVTFQESERVRKGNGRFLEVSGL